MLEGLEGTAGTSLGEFIDRRNNDLVGSPPGRERRQFDDADS